MKKKISAEVTFGWRLAAFRKAAGLTQVQLAETLGSTQRALSYYENDGGYPPLPLLAQLAEALGVSTDELLGVAAPPRTAAVKTSEDSETRRLWKKFQQLLTLPEKDQRAVMRLVNSLTGAKGD